MQHVQKGHTEQKNAAWSHDLKQRKWDEPSKNCWAHRLILSIRLWLKWKHGEINYKITHFVTGHPADYRQYLYRFGLDDSPNCPVCSSTLANPDHVKFYCARFVMKQGHHNRALGRSEAEWEIDYGFLRTCKNTKRDGEGNMGQKSSKDEKHLKAKQFHEVIRIWWF